VNQRDEEIVRIAKSIEELANIFKELAVLVIDQGTILDRIDYNMENAVEAATEGVKQLEKAEEHQKNSMSVKCIILLVVLIIIMVGILIWKHSDKKK
jgi:syntaxin 16